MDITTLAREIERGGPAADSLVASLRAVVPRGGAKSISTFARTNDISRSQIYVEINAGRLKTIRVGKRQLITGPQEADWHHLCAEEAKRVAARAQEPADAP